ncbi:MAG: hypothetical protein IJ197_02655 [Bacteroidaceae bacterium]|nr:hypothetical protein [Bacteroidaceae bacterium]
MKKKIISKFAGYLMLAAGMLTASCSNEESTEAPQTVQSLTRAEVVNVLKNINIDATLASEIHSFVSDAMASGRDEKISFNKMLSGDVKTRANGQALIAERIKSLITSRAMTRSVNGTLADANLLNELADSDFIIYWPYSENWDGKELPTLVAAPKDEDAEEAYGLRIIDGTDGLQYEKVLVNEDYAELHPVWVVNQEVEDPNVVYAITSDASIEEGNAPMYVKKRSEANPIYVWRLKRMKVTHQYDGIFRGGSDFDIQIAYPISTGNVSMPNKIRVFFSRKDIRKKKWKNVNALLNSNWLPNQITNGMVLTEGDRGGDNVSIKLAVQFKDPVSGITSSVECSITYKSKDEYIGQLVLNRDYMLQDSILTFDNNKVTMVAPISAE